MTQNYFQDRLDAVLLVSGIEVSMWIDAGLKRYRGQARLKRIIAYLTDTVGR